ncbi:hypothetical protein OY671_011616, partial [Metschnikowia pulcherrima]
ALGTTKIRGVEADSTVRPVDGSSMGSSYAYTYTHVPPARNTVQEASNASLNPPVTTPVFETVYISYTPKNASSGSMDYESPVGGAGTESRFHVDGNYSDPVHSFAGEKSMTDKSFIVNARSSSADIPMSDGGQKSTVSAWARNSFNEEHIYRRSGANTSS